MACICCCLYCTSENEKLRVVPCLHIVLTSMVMKVKAKVRNLRMKSLLLIQGSMVGISISVKDPYIESFCLGNWTRFIKFASISYPFSSIFLNHRIVAIHVLQTWRYTLLCTIPRQTYVFLIHPI